MPSTLGNGDGDGKSVPKAGRGSTQNIGVILSPKAGPERARRITRNSALIAGTKIECSLVTMCINTQQGGL